MRTQTGFAWLLLWPAVLSPSLVGAPATDAQKQTRIAEAAVDYMVRTGSPSVSIYVDRGGTPFMNQAWGIADLEHTTPATVGTAYEMGSITTSVTAHAVLQLVVAGRVSHRAKVSDSARGTPAVRGHDVAGHAKHLSSGDITADYVR